MTRLWAKREEQLRGVLDSTAGLYGDLQGIAGRAVQEIESLDVLMIEVKGEAAEYRLTSACPRGCSGEYQALRLRDLNCFARAHFEVPSNS